MSNCLVDDCPICGAEQGADVMTLRLNVLSQTIDTLIARLDQAHNAIAQLEGRVEEMARLLARANVRYWP